MKLIIKILIIISVISCKKEQVKTMNRTLLPKNSATLLLQKQDSSIVSKLLEPSVVNLDLIKGFRSLKLNVSLDSLYLNDWTKKSISNTIHEYTNQLKIQIGEVEQEAYAKLLFYKQQLIIIDIMFQESLNEDKIKINQVLRDDIENYKPLSNLSQLYISILGKVTKDEINYENNLIDLFPWGLSIKDHAHDNLKLFNSYINEENKFYGSGRSEDIDKLIEKTKPKGNYKNNIYYSNVNTSSNLIWESNNYGLMNKNIYNFIKNDKNKNAFEPTYGYNSTSIFIKFYSLKHIRHYVNDYVEALRENKKREEFKNDSILKIKQKKEAKEAAKKVL